MSQPCEHTLSYGDGSKTAPDRCVNCDALFERDADQPFGYAAFDILRRLGRRYKKGDTVIYTSGMGFQFTARVLTAHILCGARIEVMFPIRDGVEMAGCYQGDRHEVYDTQIAARTQDGVSVDRLRQAA